MPPPLVATLLLKVLVAIITVPVPDEDPSLKMPPPRPLLPAELPVTVQLLTESVALPELAPTLKMPPPTLLAELPVTVQLLTVKVEWSLKMPPPNGKSPGARPLATVRLAML